ncbi:MAG: 50S ribosomal protein L11 methyltransferase [Cyanobacteria bacterium RM1_2_2]|nr:50S ribosomal protein L11 methyltransferase [Cyanobacteria bacterium RM1_2_2]
MQWMELSLHTTDEAIDWVRTLLATIDFTGEMGLAPYQPEQNQPEQNQPEQSAHSNQPWAYTLRLALPYDSQTMTRAEVIHRLLSPLERTGLTTALEMEMVDQQPVYTTTAIHPIGDRFVVLPPHYPYEVTSNQILLRLEPTLAFGSGLHPATVLSLRLLERHVTPTMSTLDLGCGSGILSVAMAKLGAQVLALDNDPTAVQATHQAVQLNDMEAKITVTQGSLAGGSNLGHWMGGTLLDTGTTLNPVDCFDLIVANILGRIHIALASDYRQAIRQAETGSGLLITAGFTTDQEQEVAEALTKAGFTVIDCERLGEWVALTLQLT